MKRIHNRALPVAAAFVVALPVHSQRVAAPRTMRADTPTESKNPDILPQQVTFAQLISAINGQAQHLARLKGMTDLQPSGVRLTNITTLLVGNNPQALQNALDRNSRSVTEMRAAVDANTIIGPLLAARELTSANVVAIDVAANGTVWVFFRQ